MGEHRDIALRPALPGDAEAVALLVRESLGYPAEADVVAAVIARAGSGDRSGAGPGGDQLVLVAERGGRIVGFAHAGARDSLYKGRIAELYSLGVESPARGGGVGSALLVDVERHFAAAGCGQLILGSRLDREAAHRFYEARGYHLEKRHARFAKALVPDG